MGSSVLNRITSMSMFCKSEIKTVVIYFLETDNYTVINFSQNKDSKSFGKIDEPLLNPHYHFHC